MGGVLTVNVKQCWSQLSEQVRQKINGHHPNVLLDQDARPLTEAKYWQTYVQQLSDDESMVLNWFAVERGEEGLSFRELQGNDLPLLPVPFRIALTRLRQRGVIYAVRQMWGETIFALPADIREAWLSTVLTDDLPPVNGVVVTRLAPPGILHDLFHFLVMIERDHVSVTGQGQLHKRTEQKMNIELDMTVDSFIKARWMKRNSEAISSVHVVYQLAQKCGLFSYTTERLRLNRAALSVWLQLTHTDATHKLYRHVLTDLLREHPGFAAVLWWMEQQSEWVSVRDMALYWMQHYGKAERDWEAFAGDWTNVCLEPFHGLGWLDWGEGEHGPVWRWSAYSPLAETPEAVQSQGYVQPNFEWLIPLHFPLALRWKAAQFADLVQTDQMCMYDINADAVKRGLERGWRAEEIIRFLNEHSVTPVPQNVAANIRQWESEMNGVRLERALLLTCQSEHVARQLSTHPGIGKSLRRLDDETFIAVANEAESVLDVVNELGYKLIVPEQPGLEDVPADVGELEGKQVRLHIENRYPELEEAVPGIASLPKVWTSDMREYHPSTLRQLVQRALDMQLEMEWSREQVEGRETLRPLGLVSKDGEWHVKGLDGEEQPCHIPLSQIGKVRIHLPKLT